MSAEARAGEGTQRPENEIPDGDDRAVEVTVLMPAFEEEEAILPVIEEIRGVMGPHGVPYELLIVDDASRDRTAELAASVGARVVRRPINGGAGASRKTGTKAARAPIIVMLDADGTYPAVDIPRVLAHMDRYDQVNGARRREMGTMPFLRVPAKWAIRMLACYLARTHIPDLNTGLKAFRKDVMLRYLWVVPDGFSCVTSMTLAFMTNGHSVHYIATDYRKRIGKSKFHPIKDTSRYFGTVVRMVMYFRPLRVFGPLAALLFLLTVVKAGFDIAAGSGLQQSTIMLFVAVVVVLMTGLLADLIVAQRRIV